jgi:hypothetical protein
VFVWVLLDCEHSIEAILARVLERYDVTSQEAEADLSAFVERLTRAGLVERRP